MSLIAEEMKNCPHCGGGWGLLEDITRPGGAAYRIECTGDCHAMTAWWHTEAEARAAWNRRAEIHTEIWRRATAKLIEYFLGAQDVDAWIRNDIDVSDDLEAILVEAGVYRRDTVDRPCGECCACAELGWGFPVECLKPTDAGRAALESTENEF